MAGTGPRPSFLPDPPRHPPLALARDLVGFAVPDDALRDVATSVTTSSSSAPVRAGSSCALLAGRRRVARRALVEKKTFPREKTCGDGLTPRAVRQLADDGPRGRGRRARAPLRRPARPSASARDWRWPGPSTRSSRATATRSRGFDLDGARRGRTRATPRRDAAHRRRGRRRRSTPCRRCARRSLGAAGRHGRATQRRGDGRASAGATSSSPTGRTRASAASSARRATAPGRWAWRCAATTRSPRHDDP